MSKWTFGVTVGLALGIASMARADDKCTYQGTSYSHGSLVCQSGMQFKCDDGQWEARGVTCPDDGSTAKACTIDGVTYAQGSTSCQAGMRYRCDEGKWQSLESACLAGDAPRAMQPLPKTCMLEGSTVASGSSVCKSGTMFLCENGDWRNLGTPCQ